MLAGWLAFKTFFGGLDLGRFLIPVLIAIAMWMAIGGVYLAGSHNGQAKVQAKWDAATKATDLRIAELQGEITQKEAVHGQETASISDQLHKTEAQYETTVSALNAEHALRMRGSIARAAVYQSEAQAGAGQCRDLASFTAELDGSLEEGRGLVGELQAALGQREDQLRLLGAQIVSDHKLVDGQ